jgi:nickel-dependent lactate racemase
MSLIINRKAVYLQQRFKNRGKYNITIAMQTVGLKYGDAELRFDLPGKAKVLKIKEPADTVDLVTFKADLAGHLGRLKPALNAVAVVVADKTRLCAYSEYLPVLVRVLGACGAERKNIVFYVAYGTHPGQSDAESIAAYGSVYRDYRFIHHDCGDAALFKRLGATSRGTPVLVRNDIINAGFLITFGAVSHHYFAGYGGGRKLLFPGLGYREAIYHNHGLFLDKTAGNLAGTCEPGMLAGNPLAGDIDEVVDFRPADLSIHGILDSQGKVCRLISGTGKESFFQACQEQGQNCEIQHDEPYDLVIASCGGYPKDINFIQSHKAVHNAAKFVRDEGRLIVLAQCSDGIGSDTFMPWLEMEGYRAAFDRLAESYAGNGGTALSMLEKSKRIKIYLVTDLPDEVNHKMGTTRISMEKAGALLRECSGKIGVIPNASLLVKV